jgi:tetratricopeptide (TPR) repeat protein
MEDHQTDQRISWVEHYDLFISYARLDNADQQVNRLVDLIHQEQRTFAPTVPLKLFFDETAIVTGELWREKLRKGLRNSKLFLAILSPNYFASEYCRWELEEFLRLEQRRILPGQALHPVFIVEPASLAKEIAPEHRARLEQLLALQGIKLEPYWTAGRDLLRDDTVRQLVHGVVEQSTERIGLARRMAKVPRSEFERNPNFVGRITELRRLREALTNHEVVGVTAVHGIGGIGKTSLAIEYAFCHRPHYLGGIFLIRMEHVRTVEDLQLELITLAQTKLPHAKIDPQASLARQFAQARAAFAAILPDTTALLILDNLAESAAELVSAARRHEWLPELERVHVLVTSRLGLKHLGLAEGVSVDRLSLAEALQVLEQYRSFGADPADPEYLAAKQNARRWEVQGALSDVPWKAALAIANRLGRHTLMVAQVGAYCGRYDIDYVRFLEELERLGVGLALEQVGSDEAITQLIAHPQPTVDALLGHSLERLREEGPIAPRLLEYLAWLPPDYVYRPWLEALARQDDELREALRNAKIGRDPLKDALRSLADLQYLTDEEVGRTHRILQEGVRRRMGAEAQTQHRDQVHELVDKRAVALQHSHLPPEHLAEIAAIQAYAQPGLTGDDGRYGRLAYILAALHGQRGEHWPAWRAAEAGTRLCALLCDADPENTEFQRDLSISYNKLGDLAVAAGDAAAARQAYTDGLHIRERLARLAPENTAFQRDLSISYNKLGDLAVAAGDAAAARDFYSKDLEIAERLARLAPENAAWQRDLAVSYSKLIRVAEQAGDRPQARQHLAAALAVLEDLAARNSLPYHTDAAALEGLRELARQWDGGA